VSNKSVVALLEEFFSKYLPYVKGVSANTITAYQYAFQLLFGFLDDAKGVKPNKVSFETLSGDLIEEFLMYLEKERGCSVRTRNLRRAAIVTFAKYAAKKSFSASLPFYTAIIGTPKKKEPKDAGIKYFTKEEISLLLKQPDTTKNIGQRDVTLLSVLYSTGARAQELCDIMLKDVTLSSPAKVRLSGKGGKSRVVTIPDNCTAILTGYLRSRNLDVKDISMQHRHLFSSQTHEHMSISCVGGIVRKYLLAAKANSPDLFKQNNYTPHSFRHSVAVHMLEAGDSLITIKAFLGHASISSTAIYAKVTPELANKYLDERGKPLQEIVTGNAPQSLPQALPFLYR
jgi:site-specific recombinase XerD